MEDDFEVFEWKRLLTGLPPELFYLEIILRVFMVFLFLIFIYRLLGKRAQRKLSPMESILTISIGTAVGDVMLYPSIPIFYSFVILASVTGLISLLSYLKLKFKFIDKQVRIEPTVLVNNGEIQEHLLDAHLLTKEELFVMLRVDGIEYLEQVRFALFEPTGEMSVFKFEDGNYEKKTSILQDIIDKSHLKELKGEIEEHKNEDTKKLEQEYEEVKREQEQLEQEQEHLEKEQEEVKEDQQEIKQEQKEIKEDQQEIKEEQEELNQKKRKDHTK